MYGVSIYQDVPRFDAVESHQKISQCTFARAASSDDERSLAGREVATGAIQDKLVGSGRVGK